MPYTKQELENVDFYQGFVNRLRNKYLREMKSLAKVIVAEELATTYKREEELLFQTKQSIDNLIAGLESKKKDEV